MEKHLNIVCFTVPYPPDYGGVFDLYYKIRALHTSGVRIHLHCYTSGRRTSELDQFCETINYYPRITGVRSLSFNIPYIVKSRMSRALVRELQNNDYPILLEGIHSCGVLLMDHFENRNIALRLHNLEHIYYQRLYETSHAGGRKMYYMLEARMLKEFEKNILARIRTIFTVSETDSRYCRDTFHHTDVRFLPVFTGFDVSIHPGTGCFCLYHGNLSVAENVAAVEWLLNDVFNGLEIPLIIAGKNPSAALKHKIVAHRNAELISDPSDSDLFDLIGKAQCHVLPSFNATGVKLKLINALFTGRHCIVNKAAVKGSGLETLCATADDPETFRVKTAHLYRKPFTAREIEMRKHVLHHMFDTQRLAGEVIQWLS